jgi:hypothetical protein
LVLDTDKGAFYLPGLTRTFPTDFAVGDSNMHSEEKLLELLKPELKKLSCALAQGLVDSAS